MAGKRKVSAKPDSEDAASRQSSPAAIADLEIGELRDVIYSRLQGNPSIGPAVDPRSGPEPFEWLSTEFRRGNSGLRDRMSEVLSDCLDELVTEPGRWPERTRVALLDLIQDCGAALTSKLFDMVRKQLFLKTEGLGAEAHAGLLKCLVSNGHHATPDFWMQQFEWLGPEYGALVFSGLVDHGLVVAMNELPVLCVHDEACAYVRWLWPDLMGRFGAQTVMTELERQKSRLSVETFELFRRDLLPVDKPPTPVADQTGETASRWAACTDALVPTIDAIK
jgi:hypothetical protein